MVKNKINNDSFFSSSNVEELLEFSTIRKYLSKCTSLRKSEEISRNFKPSTSFQLTCQLHEETE